MKTYGKQMFIGYCHGERLLYYDVCTPDEQWTRHAAAGTSMLDVPQYSIDEEWRILTRGAAYNAAFTAQPREIIMVKNERGWELTHPHLNNPASMLASLKRTNEGIETTGLKFKVYKKQNIGGWGFGWIVSTTHWETVWPDKMDEVRHVLTSQYRSLFDLERLGFVVEKFENMNDNIECTTVWDCIEYLIEKAGCTNEHDINTIIQLIEEEFKKRYCIIMSIDIDKSLTWMKDRKAARGDNRKAMGDLSVLPNDVLDKIFAGLLLH